MPNPVKYSTVTPSGSLRKGNMAIGVNPNVALGPTSVTGFYAGITPPSGGYTIYQNKVSQGPSIYVASNDSGLIRLTKEISGTTYANVAGCLNYFATQTDKIIIASSDNIPANITSGSILNLNAGMVCSYPTTASTWYDLSGNNNSGSLINGPTYSNGSIVFDGVDDTVSFPAITLGSTFTITQTLVASAAYNNIGYMPIGGGHVASGSTYRGYVWFQTNNDATNPVGATVALAFRQDGEAGGFDFSFPTPIPRYTLLQYTLVKNGSTANFYINGTLMTTQSVESARNFTVRNLGWSYSSYYMNRNLYNTQIYNRALPQSEVLQNYYQAPIVTNGLVLAVDAGNVVSYVSGSTTTYSLTGSLSGSLVNGTGFTSNNGGSWNFDGVDDYISVPDNPVLDFTGSVNLTSEVWIKFNQYKDISFVNAKGDGGGSVNNYNYFFIGTNTSFYFRFSDGTTTQSSPIITQTNLPTGSWGHVVGVLDTTAIRLYLNGVEIGTATTRTINPKANNSSFLISSPSYALNGSVATSRIYNRALTASEVSQNFKAQKNRFGL